MSEAIPMSYEREQEVEAKCKALFGRNWHSYTTLTRKDDQKICYWCGQPETQRALVNIWGNVHDVGACDKCFPLNHTIMRDSL